MNILFLGPTCPRIENCLRKLEHFVMRREEPLTADFLHMHQFDFGISYRYRNILTQSVLDNLHKRIINMHISLLPWNRGSDPNLWSFLEDTPKGVSIHKIDAGVDTGDILLQREINFDPRVETLKTTYEKLCTAVEDLFLASAEALLTESIQAKKQPDGGTYHRCRDKTPFLDLIEENWWDTPVLPLVGAALKKRESAHDLALSLNLRNATLEDMRFVFDLANDPEVRRMSFRSDKISWETHQAWFSRQLQERNPFYIASFDGKSCGYVRMQPDIHVAQHEVIVSVAIIRANRGMGIATNAVREACKRVLFGSRIKKIWAMIKRVNSTSCKLFSKAKFQKAGIRLIQGHEAVCFAYPGYME